MVYLGANKIKNNFSVNPVESKILVLLLDLFDAKAAYSLRRLKKTHVNCITIRRDTVGQEELTIGFNNLGDLDDVAIATFCGVDDGYLVVWHEPCNGLDTTQSISTKQPKIYDGGTGLVVKLNGKNAVDFSGTQVLISDLNHGVTGNQPRFLFSSLSGVNYSTNNMYFCMTETQNTGQRFIHTAESAVRCANSYKIFTENIYSHKLATLSFTGIVTEDVQLHINKASIGKQSSTNSSASLNTLDGQVSIGGYFNTATASYGFQGKIQEIIFFDSDRTNEQNFIEDNINNYWNIF